DHKVFLCFADDQFDFSTPEGRMHFNFLACFADWYIKNLSRETKKGKSSLVLIGKQNNRPPFGYQKRNDGTFEIIPEEANLVKEAFEKYASGNYTDIKIADMFNIRNVRTRSNHFWSKESVRAMLVLDFYYGAVKYLDTLYQGNHEALISKELFNQVQVIRKTHAIQSRTVTSKLKHVYLLNGLIRCASCGRNLRAESSPLHRYYREVSNRRGLECPDARTAFRADMIEQEVGNVIIAFKLPPDWQQEIRDALKSESDQERLEETRRETTQKLKRLGDLYMDGLIERPDYQSKRDELTQLLDGMALPEPTKLIETGQALESFLQVWPLANEKQKRDICRLMFEWVETDMQQARITRVMPRHEFAHFFENNPLLVHDMRGGYALKV
ncbi:MAG: recombinase family protein, partial [Anaerolineales bacterium]